MGRGDRDRKKQRFKPKRSEKESGDTTEKPQDADKETEEESVDVSIKESGKVGEKNDKQLRAGEEDSNKPKVKFVPSLKEPEKEDRKYSRREIVSNWKKYEEELIDTPEEDENTLRGTEFEDVLSVSRTGSSHFRLKSEKEWDEAESAFTNEFFSLDLQNLAKALTCVPFYKRLRIPESCFTEQMLMSMKKEAAEIAAKYVPPQKTFMKQDGKPVNQAEEITKRFLNILKDDELKDKSPQVFTQELKKEAKGFNVSVNEETSGISECNGPQDGNVGYHSESKAINNVNIKQVESKAVNNVNFKQVESKPVYNVNLKQVESKPVNNMNLKQVESKPVGNFNLKQVESEPVNNVNLKQVESKPLDNVNLTHAFPDAICKSEVEATEVTSKVEKQNGDDAVMEAEEPAVVVPETTKMPQRVRVSRRQKSQKLNQNPEQNVTASNVAETKASEKPETNIVIKEERKEDSTVKQVKESKEKTETSRVIKEERKEDSCVKLVKESKVKTETNVIKEERKEDSTVKQVKERKEKPVLTKPVTVKPKNDDLDFLLSLKAPVQEEESKTLSVIPDSLEIEEDFEMDETLKAPAVVIDTKKPQSLEDWLDDFLDD